MLTCAEYARKALHLVSGSSTFRLLYTCTALYLFACVPVVFTSFEVRPSPEGNDGSGGLEKYDIEARCAPFNSRPDISLKRNNKIGLSLVKIIRVAFSSIDLAVTMEPYVHRAFYCAVLRQVRIDLTKNIYFFPSVTFGQLIIIVVSSERQLYDFLRIRTG